MKKRGLILLLLTLFIVLVGCESNKPSPDTIETDGTQESIFDNISEALKDIFE